MNEFLLIFRRDFKTNGHSAFSGTFAEHDEGMAKLDGWNRCPE